MPSKSSDPHRDSSGRDKDDGSTKKTRTAPKEKQVLRGSSSSVPRTLSFSEAMQSAPSTSTKVHSSAGRSHAEPGSQRKAHWETILDSSTANSANRMRKPSSTGPGGEEWNSSSYGGSSSSQGYQTGQQASYSRPPRAVPIAPRGPLIDKTEEDDGCRFQCQVDGCEQRFRHRSSRSRHKKNSHSKKPSDMP